MIGIKPAVSSLLIFLFHFSKVPAAAFSFPVSYSQYKTFISLAHSLFSRVSNLRAARGDIAGANRAKLIAQSLERGLWPMAWSVDWDYIKNYSWRDFKYRDVYDALSELNQLLGFLSDFGRGGSEIERTTWVAHNYRNVLRVATAVLRRLVKVFSHSGVLKEVAETVQREVSEDDLLRDRLEVGSGDLQGLVQIIKDGVLKEVVETVQREVSEGDLLRDCLEVGSGDLQGLVQIIKDVASQHLFKPRL